MLGSATKLQTKRNIKLQGAVSGNADFDGSGNVTITTVQTNIAVLEGNISLDANTNDNVSNNKMQQTQWSIDYPAGFTKDNSILLCFSGRFYTTKGYAFGDASGSGFDSVGMVTGAIPRDITFGDKLNCQAYNMATSTKTFYYKIVIMRVS